MLSISLLVSFILKWLTAAIRLKTAFFESNIMDYPKPSMYKLVCHETTLPVNFDETLLVGFASAAHHIMNGKELGQLNGLFDLLFG